MQPIQLIKENEILGIPIVAPWKFIKGNPVEFLKQFKPGDKLTIEQCHDNSYDADAKYVMFKGNRLGFVSSDYVSIVNEMMGGFFGLDVTFAYLVVNDEKRPWFVVNLTANRDIEDKDIFRSKYFSYRFSFVSGIPHRDQDYKLSNVLKPLVIGYRNFINGMYEGNFSCKEINELNKLTAQYLDCASLSFGLESRTYLVMVINYMTWIRNYDRDNNLNRSTVLKNSLLLERLMKVERMKADEDFCVKRFENQRKEIISLFKENNTLERYYRLKFHGYLTRENLYAEKELAYDSLRSIRNSPWSLFDDDIHDFSKAVFYQRFCLDDTYDFIAIIILIEDLEKRIKHFKKPICVNKSIMDLFNKAKRCLPSNYFCEKTFPIWKEFQLEGFVDSDFKRLPEKLPRQLTAYLISRFAEYLGIKNIWPEIQDFWCIYHLAQEKSKYIDKGILPKGHEKIDDIFEKFGIV